VPTIFEKLAKHRPSPVKEKTNQPDHAQRMLDFLLRWPRPSISVPEMMTYGPKPRKNAEETLKLASILERQGWLTPKKMPRKDMRHWDITRRPVVHPKLTTAQ
jgi:hypothetical protein